MQICQPDIGDNTSRLVHITLCDQAQGQYILSPGVDGVTVPNRATDQVLGNQVIHQRTVVFCGPQIPACLGDDAPIPAESTKDLQGSSHGQDGPWSLVICLSQSHLTRDLSTYVRLHFSGSGTS